MFGWDNGDSVWIKWVDKPLQAKTKTPGTPISYLTSMQMFLTYLTRQKHDPQVHATAFPILKQTFLELIPALRGRRACIDSFPQDSQISKYIDECNSLIATESHKLHTTNPYVEGAFQHEEGRQGWPTRPQGVHFCKGLPPLQVDVAQ